MIIRKAERGDVSKLFALENELFQSENFPLSRRAFAYHLRHNLIIVCEIDGDIVGYALVLIRRKNAKLYSIGVNKAYRGKKISQNLLKEIFDKVITLGFKILTLEVRVDNDIAISLYKHSGFEVKKVLKDFYLDGCDAYLMEMKNVG